MGEQDVWTEELWGAQVESGNETGREESLLSGAGDWEGAGEIELGEEEQKDRKKARSRLISWKGDYITKRLQAGGEEEKNAWFQAMWDWAGHHHENKAESLQQSIVNLEHACRLHFSLISFQVCFLLFFFFQTKKKTNKTIITTKTTIKQPTLLTNFFWFPDCLVCKTRID